MFVHIPVCRLSVEAGRRLQMEEEEEDAAMFPWWSHRRGDQSLMPACALSPSLPILIYFNLPHAFKPPWQMAELANHRTQQWRAVTGAPPTGQTHCCSLSLSFSGQLSQNIFNVWRLKAAKWWLHKTKHWSAVNMFVVYERCSDALLQGYQWMKCTQYS